MHVRNLFADDRAVSPVIGVILMVAITVILAAVIGTFVLGLGDQLGENAPSASYSWDQSGSGDDLEVDLEHRSGENFENSTVSVTHDGSSVGDTEQDNFRTAWGGPDGIVSAGSTVTFHEASAGDSEGDVDVNNLDTDSTLRIVWEAPGGGTSSTLTSYTVD